MDFYDKQIVYMLIVYIVDTLCKSKFTLHLTCFSFCRIPEYGAVLRFTGERVQLFRTFC